ncbi:MAG: ABC transporter permease [Microbacterium sp.]|nr:MAG: ABC transporter permease [Microbacterium sp.]
MPSLVRQARVSLTVATLAVALLGAFLPLVSGAADSAATRKDGLGAIVLRTVELGAYRLETDPKPLTLDNLADLETWPEVESVNGWAQVDMTLITDRSSATLALTPRIPGLQPPLVEGREPRADDEVVVSAAVAEDLGIIAGDVIDAEHIERAGSSDGWGEMSEATIVGLYDPSVQGVDGPEAAYGTEALVVRWVNAATGHSTAWAEDNYTFPKAYITLTSIDATKAFMSDVAAEGYSPTSLSAMLSGVSTTQAFLDGLRPMLSGVLGVALLFIGWATASAFVASRRAEVGVLRALGWARYEVGGAFTAQFAAQGALVGGVGAAIALATTAVLSTVGPLSLFGVPLEARLDAPFLGQLGGVVVGAVCCFSIAAFVPVWRASSIAPDDVLRDVRG